MDTYITEFIHCREVHNDSKQYREEIHCNFVVKHKFLCELQGSWANEVDVIGPKEIPQHDHEK